MCKLIGDSSALSAWRAFADDDIDAVLFRKIKSGKYDADDPIWDGISASAKDLVVNCISRSKYSILTVA